MSSTKTPGQKILRIGLFQNGEFIEERLIHSRGAVTIGQDYRKNTFVVPASKLPKSMTVFEAKDGAYIVHFDKDTAIKLSRGDGGSKATGELVQSGIATKGPAGYQVALNQKSYGRIAWGTGDEEVALLFQFVTPPPPRPKPVLPASMRGGIVNGVIGSLILAITCSVSAVLQIGFVAFLLSRDWPQPRDLEYDIPDRFVKIMVEDREEEIEVTDEKMEVSTEEEGEGEEPKEEAPAEEAPKEKEPEKEKTPEERAAEEAERKRRMAEEVKNQTILGQLGALSESGSIVDTLSEGAGRTSMEEAFANSQGITSGALGAEKSGLRTTGSSGADGKGSSVGIGDLKGTKGAAAAKQGVDSGEKTEKKVRVKLKYEKEQVVGSGTLDANAISSVIKRRQTALQRCYERQIKKDPTASGKVVVAFTIGTAGRVTTSKAVGDSVGGGVGDCVAGEIQRMRFPRPQGGEVMVNKTFVFEVSQ